MNRSILIVGFLEFRHDASSQEKTRILRQLRENLKLHKKHDLHYARRFGQWFFSKVIWSSDLEGKDMLEFLESSKQQLELFNFRIFPLPHPDEEVHYESGFYKEYSLKSLQEAAHA